MIEDQKTQHRNSPHTRTIENFALINQRNRTYVTIEYYFRLNRKFGQINTNARSLTAKVYEPSTFSLEILKTHSKNIDSQQKRYITNRGTLIRPRLEIYRSSFTVHEFFSSESVSSLSESKTALASCPNRMNHLYVHV